MRTTDVAGAVDLLRAGCSAGCADRSSTGERGGYTVFTIAGKAVAAGV